MIAEFLYNMVEQGAVGDGRTDNTEVFRQVCRDCGEAGGGAILLPPGRYLTGPFELFSNTEFRVAAGAEILASAKVEDYFTDGNSMESPRIGLIYARNAENITLTGRGSIDLQGAAFMDMTRITQWIDFDRESSRQPAPYLDAAHGIGDGPVMVLDRPGNSIQFLGCKNVELSQLTLKNAPNWTVQLGNSEDIFVRGLRILNNMLIANSDGVHCTSCRNVHISDCHIESGDDSIAITSLTTGGRICENVTVTNCTLFSRSAGVRVGYGEGDIRNCLFQNLVIEANRGVAVFARDNNVISDVSFNNIKITTRLHDGQWWGHAEPVHVSAVRANAEIPPGRISNISFSNILAKGESGIIVYGSEKGCLDRIRFHDIQLNLATGPLTASYGGNFDLRPAADPALKLFAHDEGGFFAKNAASLTVRDLSLGWDENPAPVFSYGIRAEDCDQLAVKGFRCSTAQIRPELQTAQLQNCTIES